MVAVAEAQQATIFGREDRVVTRQPTKTQVRFVQLETLAGGPMPYFNFDLVIGNDFKSQGGMILEDTPTAIDKAESLASELCVVRPELRSRKCAVRITDGDSNELYRTPLDLVPPWLKSSRPA